MKAILISLTFLMSTFSLTKIFGQNKVADTLIVRSVDLYLLTDSDVSCDEFEQGLRSRLTTTIITESNTLHTFGTYVQNARFAKKNYGIDTRANFTFIRSFDSTKVCINLFDVYPSGEVPVFL